MRWGWLAAVVAAFALTGLAAALSPDVVLEAARKEGLLEQISHVVLCAGIVAWAIRLRVAPRWVPSFVVALLLLVLAEELDWGAAFGFNAFSDVLQRVTGAPNLHNAWSGASYVLFAGPWLAYFATAFAPTGWRDRLGPHAARRDEALAVTAIAIVAIATTALPSTWERALDEILELLLYAVIAASSLQARVVDPVGRS